METEAFAGELEGSLRETTTVSNKHTGEGPVARYLTTLQGQPSAVGRRGWLSQCLRLLLRTRTEPRVGRNVRRRERVCVFPNDELSRLP